MFRKDFPIFTRNPDIVFLDSASSAQKPQKVIDDIASYMSGSYANIHRGAYDLSMDSSILYDKAKRKLAEFLGCSQHEVVFTYNATYAVNLIARGLAKTGILKQWDTILLCQADHHANIVPWQIIAEENELEILWMDLHADWTIDYDDIKRKIEKVELLAITGASNVTGEVLDMDIMQSIFANSRKNPLFVVDGSQRFPHMATDVVGAGIDFYIGTGHKVMSDTGIGFFYWKKELLKEINPAFCGGGAINGVTIEWYDPAGLPFRHEPGTPHIVGAVSLLSALEYIESIGGYREVEKYEKELTEYALQKFANLPKWMHLLGSKNAKNRLGVFSFSFDEAHPHDVAEELADRGICVRSGHHCAEPLHHALGVGASLRASLYIYSTKKDIDDFYANICNIVS